MLEFTPLQLNDRERYLRGFAPENCQNSTYSFGTVYLWSLHCRRNLAELGERVVVEYLCNSQNPFYGWPLGSGSIHEAITALREHAEANGRRFTLRAITREQKEQLESAYPGSFDFTPEEENFDYIDDIEL